MMVRIATKASCLLLLTMLSYVVKGQPAANFTATITSGCSPLVIHFTDLSTNQPTQWKWNLGNGTISYLKNPSVTYFNPGKYTIKLIVKNSAGIDSITKTQFITVFALPNVQFSSSATIGCHPLIVKFTDQSTAADSTITSWQWDFGDGYASAIQDPTHTYTTSGNFNVTLRVRNNNNCLSTLSKSQYIKIGSSVKANFSNNDPNNCSLPVTINFKNSSTGTSPLVYNWLFGDGTNSNEINPSHIYANFGTYTVQLIVTNTSGCTDTITRANTIVISTIQASFSNTDTVCEKQPVFFTNNSTPKPVSTYWNFGDGTFSTKLNPIKIYSSAGSYQVKLVSNYSSCADSIIKTIIVGAKPLASFISDATISCKNPLLVQFINQSLNAISYQWNFGDGTQSTTKDPAHIFNGNGHFSIQLIATNANGCSDTVLKKNMITIQKPNVSFNNLPDSGCVPFTKTFTSSTVTIDSVVSYLWNFGDSSISIAATPTHTFTNAGVYTISLIETTKSGCTDTSIINRGIITTTKPAVNFSAFPTTTCAKSFVSFKDLTAPTATKWLWLFGDSTTSSLQNPTHFYNDTGKFTIQLIVWNGGCSDTLTYKDYIQINAPIGSFIFTMNCKKPYERIFTDQSIGADEWNWNFGDGSLSTQQNPIHSYSTSGIYDVTLLVKNYSTGCDYTTKKTISIVDVKAAFSTVDTTVCKGSNVVFTTNISATNVNAFNWNFGDNTSPGTTINSASHIYSKPGNYSVQLAITDVLGCNDTLTKINYIRVNGPTAKFSSSVPGTCLNNTVTFTDLSISDGLNPIKSFTWDYADGQTEIKSTGSFQHSYSTTGIYTVKLTVSDNEGCKDSFSIPTALVISKPIAAFASTENISCPTKPVTFINQSTGPGLSYLWSFGDGATAGIQNPFHAFTNNGIFTVTLVIKDQYGCTDSISKPNIVSIVSPIADFKMSDSLSACPPLIVQVTNLSSNDVSKTWDFGDGTSSIADNPSHFYSYPGNYVVTLNATSPGGCSSSYQKTIYIKGPRGTFSYPPITACNKVTSTFTASTTETVSLIWDFNDGTTLNSTDTITQHEYNHAGSYIPKIILTDNAGCHVPIIGKDTIVVNGITTGFNFESKIVCDSATISFLDSSFSNDLITNYNWYLGDGSSSTEKNPVHQYSTNGLYYPKLVITSKFGCTDSLTSPVALKVIGSPKIKIASTANGCAPLAMVLNGIVTVTDTSSLTWKWDLANNNTSALQNPLAQNYTTPGIYTIALVAINSSGCSDTVKTSIEAYSIPALNVARDTFVCQHKGINLQATGANTYNWSPSTGLSCTTCSTLIANPDSAINYIVKGTSIHGCTAFDTIKVIVKYPFKMGYSKQDTLCKGESKKLFANGANYYLWTPSAGLNNNTSATPTAQTDTTTNYMVVGTDDKGCFKDTGYVFIKVFPIPQVNAGGYKTINIGKTLDLLPVISSDVTEVLWSPTTGIFRNSYPGISIKPTTNTEYTVVVKNAGGCSAQDKVSVYVICNGANVFIPNTFSPNGDGANDIFYPRGSGLFKIKTLRIFNRWGEVVFEKNSFDPNDASAGWDGTFKGVKLNSDVFVYTIDIICDNNSILVYKGNVALIQ